MKNSQQKPGKIPGDRLVLALISVTRYVSLLDRGTVCISCPSRTGKVDYVQLLDGFAIFRPMENRWRVSVAH